MSEETLIKGQDLLMEINRCKAEVDLIKEKINQLNSFENVKSSITITGQHKNLYGSKEILNYTIDIDIAIANILLRKNLYKAENLLKKQIYYFEKL